MMRSRLVLSVSIGAFFFRIERNAEAPARPLGAPCPPGRSVPGARDDGDLPCRSAGARRSAGGRGAGAQSGPRGPG